MQTTKIFIKKKKQRKLKNIYISWRVFCRGAAPYASLRWHPDKFAARFSHSLVDADRERVMERVSAISQSVKEQWSGWEEAHDAS